jgi:hypothetical protein
MVEFVRAQDVANLLSETLVPGEHNGEIEHKMRELLQEAGQKGLQILLEEKGKAQGREIRWDCGGPLGYVGQRQATVITILGRVTYKRAYYSGCGCGLKSQRTPFVRKRSGWGKFR